MKNKTESMMTLDFPLSPRIMAERMQEAWRTSWRLFFLPRTSLFYDYITGYEADTALAFTPTPDEIRRSFPNPCGWGTGMEDSAIHAGVMMAMVCDRFDITGEPELADYARRIFTGMVNLGGAHGVPGFIARSICPDDGCSVYPESSRDQYTHVVHGLWRYYHSPLSGERERESCRRLIRDICEYARRCATPECGYLLLRCNNEKSSGISCKLLNVAAHEAARLPMFYAAAWDLTGDERWRGECLKYLDSALSESMRIGEKLEFYPAYSLMQVQCSMEVLRQVFHDHAEVQAACRKTMRRTAEVAEFNARHALHGDALPEVSSLCGDWRSFAVIRGGNHGYAVPQPPEEWRIAFWRIRESGEAAVAQLMASPVRRMSALQLNLLQYAVCRHDFKRIANSGLFYLQRAYWLAVRFGYIAPAADFRPKREAAACSDTA